MAHFCRICRTSKSNESFSGKGHRGHICKKCKKLPLGERKRVEHEEEIFGFLGQSNISKKNLKRLEILSRSTDQKISERANIVIEVAKFHSNKKGRLKKMAWERRDILFKLETTGLIYARHIKFCG